MMYVPRAPDFVWGDPKAEVRADMALLGANTPGTVLAQQQAPLPQVVRFRSRLGYPSYQQRQITIDQIIDVPRIYSDPHVQFTGTPAGYSGTSRPSMGNGF